MACGKLINGGVLSNRVSIFHQNVQCRFRFSLTQNRNSKPNRNNIH